MSKSQAELEQPAKRYELAVVDSKVDTVLEQLKTIVNQTAGLATLAQLETLKIDMKEDLAEAVKDIHAEYRPTLKRTNWLYTTVIAEAVGLLGAAIWVIILMKR